MNKQTYDSYEHLVECISRSMPDEYPTGMANSFADDMIKNSKVIIRDKCQPCDGTDQQSK